MNLHSHRAMQPQCPDNLPMDLHPRNFPNRKIYFLIDKKIYTNRKKYFLTGKKLFPNWEKISPNWEIKKLSVASNRKLRPIQVCSVSPKIVKQC